MDHRDGKTGRKRLVKKVSWLSYREFVTLSTAQKSFLMVAFFATVIHFSGPTSSLQTRDRSHCVSFLEDHRSKQCLLLIGGRRGIRVHDFESGGLFRSFDSKCTVFFIIKGYEHQILGTFTSLHSWSGCMLMAGSLEGEVTLWDIRKPSAVATFGKRAASSGILGKTDHK